MSADPLHTPDGLYAYLRRNGQVTMTVVHADLAPAVRRRARKDGVRFVQSIERPKGQRRGGWVHMALTDRLGTTVIAPDAHQEG